MAVDTGKSVITTNCNNYLHNHFLSSLFLSFYLYDYDSLFLESNLYTEVMSLYSLIVAQGLSTFHVDKTLKMFIWSVKASNGGS